MLSVFASPAPGKRVAFIIANSAYETVARLPGPVADHDVLTMRLEDLGFVVLSKLNMKGADADGVLATFLDAITGAETALFYYSGHGLQVGDENYIVPVDYRIDRADPRTGLIPLKPWIRTLQVGLSKATSGGRRRTCLVFLDACRDNLWRPETPDVRVRAGLADMTADGDETFIAFATAPGTTAVDAEPSPFTKALARYANVRGGVSVDDVMRWVAQSVRGDTKGHQRPWNHDNLTSDWSFIPRDLTPVHLLLMMGLLAGAIAGLLVFDNRAHLVPLVDGTFGGMMRHALAGLTLGMVIGFAVWKWGSPAPWAAPTACLGTATAYLIAMTLLQPISVGWANQKSPELRQWLTDHQFSLVLNTIIAASLIFAIGTVAAAAASTRAFRRPSAFVYALVAGASVTLIYLVIEGARMLTLGREWAAPDSPERVRLLVRWVAIPLAGGLWFALFAFCIGYSITTYAPRTREEADRDLDEPQRR